jgi:hypothetical protein
VETGGATETDDETVAGSASEGVGDAAPVLSSVATLLVAGVESGGRLTEPELAELLSGRDAEDELGVPKTRLVLLALPLVSVWFTAAGATVRSEMSLPLSGAGLTSTRSRMMSDAA